MGINGDVSEQVVRLSLEGFEVIAKLTGSGAKNVATMLYAIMKDQKQTKGKTRLNNMLKTGKPLKIFTIKSEDLQRFTQEAKKYGILYCALLDKKNRDFDGLVDIMVKNEDAGRINRIVERFKLSTIDTAKIKTEVTESIEKREALKNADKSIEEKVEDILYTNPNKQEAIKENFNLAKTRKSPLSEPILNNKDNSEQGTNSKKTSVREEIKKIKEELKSKELDKSELKKENVSKDKTIDPIQKTNTKRKKLKERR